jgi:ribosome-associated translation inhibitor RaiA
MFRKWLFVGTLISVLWLGFLLTPASSQQIDSRINNLEADFNRVLSRLNQIEGQINQRQPVSSPRTTITVPSGSRRNVSQTQREQMFDRLAILVVELKQQVNKLEARVGKLESR